MSVPSPHTLSRPDAVLARRFAVAWAFLVISAALGLILRLQVFVPWPPLPYGHLLHAHSHVAFLGWVFNAFLVVALRHFLPAEAGRTFDLLWWVLQVAVLGMLLSFPWQGYGPVSIAFSTLHVAASAVFAVRLWRRNCAAPAARIHLRAALVFLVLSAAGPLTLGPLAAAGLRDSPVYTLAIYWYLHFQYNGWFTFFLQALALQHRTEVAPAPDVAAARRAGHWLFVGGLLSYAVSTLWCDPPAAVHAAAAAGGVAQVVGGILLLRVLAGPALRRTLGQYPLLAVAGAVFLFKPVLQLAAVLPGLTTLAHQRFVAIAFLHLVFLGLVIPALVAWAQEAGWFRPGWLGRTGLGLFLAGALITEGLLVAPTLAGLAGWSFDLPLAEGLLAGAGALFAGVAVLGLSLRRR